MTYSHVSFRLGSLRLLVSFKLHRRRWRQCAFHVWEELELDGVLSSAHIGFGGVVPLRSAGAFVIEVSVTEVLVRDDVVADVIVVVTYVVAVIDNAVAKVMEYVLWRLLARSSSGGGGSWARLFFVASSLWRSWPAVLTGEQGGGPVLATCSWALVAASWTVMSVDVPARVLGRAAVVWDAEP